MQHGDSFDAAANNTGQRAAHGAAKVDRELVICSGAVTPSGPIAIDRHAMERETSRLNREYDLAVRLKAERERRTVQLRVMSFATAVPVDVSESHVVAAINNALAAVRAGYAEFRWGGAVRLPEQH